MELTETHLKILADAHALAQICCGQVIADTAFPEAHALAEAGWLERRVEPDGEMSWWWTPTAELALDLNALTSNHAASVN